MRITLLIFLIITALSKNFADIYNTEKQIQKEALNKCILNSNELREDMKEIYGDIQKALINHYYLDILKKLGDYNPRNNKILFHYYNELLDEKDHMVLEKGLSSRSSSRSCQTRSAPTRSTPTRSSPIRGSSARKSPTRAIPTQTKIIPKKKTITRISTNKTIKTRMSATKTHTN